MPLKSVMEKHFSKVWFTLSNQDSVNAESQTNQFHIQQVSCVAQRLGSLFWSVKTNPFRTCFFNPHFFPRSSFCHSIDWTPCPQLLSLHWGTHAGLFRRKLLLLTSVWEYACLCTARAGKGKNNKKELISDRKIVWEQLQVIAHRRLN